MLKQDVNAQLKNGLGCELKQIDKIQRFKNSIKITRFNPFSNFCSYSTYNYLKDIAFA